MFQLLAQRLVTSNKIKLCEEHDKNLFLHDFLLGLSIAVQQTASEKSMGIESNYKTNPCFRLFISDNFRKQFSVNK